MGFPFDALPQHVTWNIFNDTQCIYHEVTAFFGIPSWSTTYATIPCYYSSNACRPRWLTQRIPHGLRIVVCMYICPARTYNLASSINYGTISYDNITLLTHYFVFCFVCLVK